MELLTSVPELNPRREMTSRVRTGAETSSESSVSF